ncbi:MAG TPA: ribonuclease Y [Thermoanaerobaculia bacterium]|nr:ribonuclease Y [Thermoanaerobaculia bacterium]
MNTTETIVIIITGALIGAVVLAALWRIVYRKRAEAQLDEARKNSERIIEDARKAAEARVKEADLEAKEKLLQMRSDFDRQAQQRRDEMKTAERRLQQKEENLDRKTQQIESRLAEVDKRDRAISDREKGVENREAELDALVEEQHRKLEQISGLTVEQAKQELIRGIENDAKLEAAQIIKRIETEAVELGNQKARKILGMAMQRMASDYVAENTVSVVDLPSEDMKGRIIGREGRNIRALELATGVDLIVDDTPEAVILSGFDPIRREIARISLERLMQDGRIHPARIEELVEKVRQELDQKLFEEGEAAAFSLGITDIHPEVLKLLGRLRYRTSYGQNVLVHSLEVAQLAALMAVELGVNDTIAKRGGLLHDIGKAIDREMEGTHLELGRQVLDKYGEKREVIHAMECHHGDYDPTTVEAVLVNAADALSAARPGARREILENYVHRLERLEGIANAMEGVSKSFAIQAGRELRIIVNAEKIGDEQAIWLSKDVARKIESELQYPGQIKVTVIREMRAIDYAK